jgi:hypothetical protein
LQDSVLLTAGGFAQFMAGNSQLDWVLSNFDDPMDQANIKRGIKAYKTLR